jgi:hypothetical protein
MINNLLLLFLQGFHIVSTPVSLNYKNLFRSDSEILAIYLTLHIRQTCLIPSAMHTNNLHSSCTCPVYLSLHSVWGLKRLFLLSMLVLLLIETRCTPTSENGWKVDVLAKVDKWIFQFQIYLITLEHVINGLFICLSYHNNLIGCLIQSVFLQVPPSTSTLACHIHDHSSYSKEFTSWLQMVSLE